MHSGLGHALLVIGALSFSAIEPGHAMVTTGDVDPGAAPPWLSVTEPYQARLPALESALLPPQVERVLMLDLDDRSGRSAESVIDTLFAKSAARGDGGRLGPASSVLHPERLAGFALLLIVGGLAGRRLRRKGRLARLAGRSRSP